MASRKVLLRLMLASLAVAAVAGVAGVLFGGRYSYSEQVVATGFAAAGAVGVMMVLSRFVDRAVTRTAALFGMGAVIFEFFLLLMVIWEVGQWLTIGGVDVRDSLAITAGCVVPTAIAAVCCLWLWRLPVGRVAGLVGLVFCAVGTLAWLIGAWADLGWDAKDQYFGTAGLMLAYGTAAVLCCIGMRTGDRRYWRWLGVVCGAAGLALGLYMIWADTEELIRQLAYVSSVAAVVGYVNIVLYIRLPAGYRWLQAATIVMAAATAFFIDLMVSCEGDYGAFETAARFAGASGILTACGAMAMLILLRLHRGVDYEPGSTQMVEMSLVCPRCGKKQTLPIGEANCQACDLRIRIQVEEPRCPSCGYLLYQLQSQNCPECGAVLAGR